VLLHMAAVQIVPPVVVAPLLLLLREGMLHLAAVDHCLPQRTVETG
jgi:hypothetical protein